MKYRYNRSCDVDGCHQTVFIENMSTPSDISDEWRVQHGNNPEVVRGFTFRALFVDEGYKGWVQEVHAYEQ